MRTERSCFDSGDRHAIKGDDHAHQVDLPRRQLSGGQQRQRPPPFTVTKSLIPASLPAPQATVDAIEFGFRGATTLHDGELVRFKNNGYLIHMVQAAQVASIANAARPRLSCGRQYRCRSKLAIAPLEMWADRCPRAGSSSTSSARPRAST